MVRSYTRRWIGAVGCLMGLSILPWGCETGKPAGPSATGSNANSGPAAKVPVMAAADVSDVTSRVTSPPVGKIAGQTRRAGGDPVDDRVEVREYLFK